jgi:hypothetical protein
LKRILIVKGNGLLSAGMEYLLDCEVDLSIQSISIANSALLASNLDNFEPEVIVLDERIYLSGHCDLMRLLTAYSYLPFIVVSANANVIHVYTPQELSVTHASDFANAVRNI